ncbi:MAG: outer membrane beta-barrel protein [Pseudomonadales bacterium]
MKLQRASGWAWMILALTCAAPVAAESGWYGAVSLGVATLDRSGSLPGDGFLSLDDNQPAYGIEVGYAINRHIAIEIGYHDLGEHHGSGFYCPPGVVCPQVIQPARADTEAWHLSAVPSWPVGRYVSLYGKLGVARWRLEPRLPRGPQARLPDVRESDFRAALGLRLALRERLEVTIEGAGFDDFRSYLLGLRLQF